MKRSRIRPLLIVSSFNAAEQLPELIARIDKSYTLEDLLIIDDGSLDNTRAILSSSEINHIRHAENLGKGEALKTGLRFARQYGYYAAITIDADLQHSPEEVSELLKVARRNSDALVIGSRMTHPTGMPLHRQLSNNLTSLVISIFSHMRIRDSQSGFRLIPLKALGQIRERESGFMFESEMLLQLSVCDVQIVDAPISVVYNDARSHIKHVMDPLRFLRLIWRRLWY